MVAMQELTNILKELGNTQQTEQEVKKLIVEHFQKKERSKKEILEVLNIVLEAWDKEPATIGCVKHHWK